jgi:hypothetical protein
MLPAGLECRKPATVRRSSKRIGAVSGVYFDTSYIARFYFNEPESPRIRELVRKADAVHAAEPQPRNTGDKIVGAARRRTSP